MKKIIFVLILLSCLFNLSSAYGDLMFDEDGKLRDPTPGDGYTAAQGYWILALMILAFFIWVGACSGNPYVFVVMCIVAIILSIVVFNW